MWAVFVGNPAENGDDPDMLPVEKVRHRLNCKSVGTGGFAARAFCLAASAIQVHIAPIRAALASGAACWSIVSMHPA